VVGLYVLLAGGAVIAVLAAATARRPISLVDSRDGYFAGWAQLHGGYDPRTGGRVVRGWLSGAYVLAAPLARRGVLPDVLTLLGVWSAGAVVVVADQHGRWLLLATFVLAASGIVDNLDGCVAVLTARTTAYGTVLDSVVDRVADGLTLVALWRVGAAAGWCVGAGCALVLLEYTRARAGVAGLSEVGVVTVGERPTRIVVASFGLFCGGLFVDHRVLCVTLGAAATLGVSLIGLVQLGRVVQQRLG